MPLCLRLPKLSFVDDVSIPANHLTNDIVPFIVLGVSVAMMFSLLNNEVSVRYARCLF